MEMSADLVIRIFLAVFSLIAAVLNVIVLWILSKVKIVSKLTRSLFIAQSTCDAFTGLIVFLYKTIGPEILTRSDTMNQILCTIWYQDNLMWIGIIAGMEIIPCISLDRLMAIFWPILHRSHQKLLIICFFNYIVLITIVLFLPNLFLRLYYDGHCHYEQALKNPVVDFILKIDPFNILVWFYIVPILVLIGSHIFILSKLFVRKHVGVNCVGSGSTDIVKKKTRDLALTVLAIAVIMLVFHAYDSTIYFLDSVGIYRYILGSTSQQAAVLLIIISRCIIPCVLVVSTPCLSRYLVRQMFCRFKQPPSDSSNETRSCATRTAY